MHGVGQLADLLIGLAPRAPARRLAQFAVHRRTEPRQPAFDQIVIGAGPHRRDRQLFADCTGDQEKGQVKTARLDQLEGLHSAEPWHPVIGDHEIPRRLVQRRLQRLGGVHPLGRHRVTGVLEFAHQQLGVELGVVDQQDAQIGLFGGGLHVNRLSG